MRICPGGVRLVLCSVPDQLCLTMCRVWRSTASFSLGTAGEGRNRPGYRLSRFGSLRSARSAWLTRILSHPAGRLTCGALGRRYKDPLSGQAGFAHSAHLLTRRRRPAQWTLSLECGVIVSERSHGRTISPPSPQPSSGPQSHGLNAERPGTPTVAIGDPTRDLPGPPVRKPASRQREGGRASGPASRGTPTPVQSRGRCGVEEDARRAALVVRSRRPAPRSASRPPCAPVSRRAAPARPAPCARRRSRSRPGSDRQPAAR